jgi:hypothetical protein
MEGYRQAIMKLIKLKAAHQADCQYSRESNAATIIGAGEEGVDRITVDVLSTRAMPRSHSLAEY